MLAMTQRASKHPNLHGGASSSTTSNPDSRSQQQQSQSQPAAAGLQSQAPLPLLPLRPATPMTGATAPAASAAATASTTSVDTTMTDKNDDNHSDSKSDKDSDSEQSQNGTKRRRTKRRPHKFYCTEYPPCSLSFTRSEHLSRHIRRHTGERPFKCHCGRCFTRLDNLRQHAQTVHANEPIPPDSLAAHGGRNRQNITRGKRASISQHPVNGVPPMVVGGGHARSISTPTVNYSGQPAYGGPSFNAPIAAGPGGGPPFPSQHPNNVAPNGHSVGPGGPPQSQSQLQLQQPPPPQSWGGAPGQQTPHSQYPGPPQFNRAAYGHPPPPPPPLPPLPPPPPPPPPMSHGPPAGHVHGHNRSRSLMTPAEISRPGPPSLRDNMNKLRQPSYAALAGGAQGPPYGSSPQTCLQHQPPLQTFGSSPYRGHNRGQSHSAVIGHSGHGHFGHSFSGPNGGSHGMRSLNSGQRESRLPQYNLREEMERVRSNASSNNTANTGNTNSQSPVTPTEEYYQSPVTSPTFSPGRDFGSSRDHYAHDHGRDHRGSVSSFDYGRGSSISISNGGVDGGDRLAPLPRPTGNSSSISGSTGLPNLSLAAYSRGGSGSSHIRSQSWNPIPGSISNGESLTLPPLNLRDDGERGKRRNPLGDGLMEPRLDI